jgi:glycosyltransferase involved in cell wall biosynthesis
MQINNDNLVSVIIPTYNRAKYIVSAMDSVFKQIYRPIELIVIDDGSTDDTAEVVKSWEQSIDQEPWFTFQYIFQDNQGATVARNLGLKIAKGEYIQFLDSDDILYPEKFMFQIEYLQLNPKVSSVLCYSHYLSADLKNCIGTAFWSTKAVSDSILFIIQNDVPIHSFLHRKDLLERIGGFTEGLPHSQEVDMHVRLALNNAKFSISPIYLCGTRFHNSPRLTDLLRNSPANYECNFWKRILEYAKTRKKINNIYEAAIAKRMVRSACKQFRCFSIANGRQLLQVAKEIAPHYENRKLKWYLDAHLFCIAPFVEYTESSTRKLIRLIKKIS